MKPSLPFRPTLLAVAIATSTSLAYSEETNTDTESLDTLDTLEVKGQMYRNTATKTQLDPEETPQVISIVSSEELEERSVESLNQALRYTAAINTELRGGAITRLDQFNTRGFDNDLVYYDGLPLLYNQQFLQAQVDATAVEQIEVFKGPASTLYGSMPPGGMVNLISKAPQKESKSSVEIGLGSDSKKEVSFDSTGALSDNINYRVLGLVRNKDGQANTSTEERIMIAPSLDITLSENTLLNINMYYQNDPSMGVYAPLPGVGTVYVNDTYGQLDSDTFLGDENFETSEREVLFFGYKLSHQLNDSWNFLQNARFTTADIYQETAFVYGVGDDGTGYRYAYATDEESTALVIDNQLSGFVDIGDAEHNILVGIDYSNIDSNYSDFDSAWDTTTGSYLNVPTINIYNPDNNQIDANALKASLIQGSDHDYETTTLGFYLQDQIRLDQWVLIAGGRYDQYDYKESGTLYYNAATENSSQNNFSGRLAALYELDNGLSPFVSYSQSFEPQAGKDTSGNSYVPTTSEQWETGVKYLGSGLAASIAAYEITKKDVLTADPNDLYNELQVGEIRSRGIELDASIALSQEVQISIAASIQDVEVTKDVTGIEGNTPIQIPEQQFSTWLSYLPNQGALVGSSFGAGIRYIGEMQMDAANTDTVPSYTLVDLSIGYDLAQLSPKWEGASVQFAVSNAFDETYFSCYSTDVCWYGADRSFELKGRYEF
ncbi:TonB-dependent siderophore receptor [Marinomonas sp. 5E14-1]|uniref:TonB-dependent siderophore receptor n=1 Tax=Marinomonas sp. 5E14-1 TaxID=3153922 RepID=UPI003265C63F